MVVPDFEEALSQDWPKNNIVDLTNELVILRQIIPWQRIIDRLVPLYDSEKGRIAKSLRMMVALVIVARLRQLSDAVVIQQVKENRYLQYFCNVPDKGLLAFLHPSTLCPFRTRLGEQGAAIIEREVFEQLRRAKVIKNDAILMDSSVLANNIIYPNDVRLLYKALDKMEHFAVVQHLPLWWDEKHVKERWRAFNLAKKQERGLYLAEFYLIFVSALERFQTQVEALDAPDKKQEQALKLLVLLCCLALQMLLAPLL